MSSFGSMNSVVALATLILFASCKGEGAPEEKLVGQVQRPEPTTIYFLGDSITAGFGFTKTGPDLNFNSEMENDWGALATCNPNGKVYPQNRCSNNSPGLLNFQTEFDPDDPDHPTVINNGDPSEASLYIAYPYVVRQMLSSARAILKKPDIVVHNYAVTGSTPANWDPEPPIPGDQSLFHGAFATVSGSRGLNRWALDQIPAPSSQTRNLFVLTVGANPLLARWLYLDLAVWFIHKTIKKGERVDCAGQKESATHCLEEDIQAFQLKEHLIRIYKYLLSKGDVLVQKYYLSCPGAFGNNDPDINIIKGPGGQNGCSPHFKEIAAYLGTTVNGVIDAAVNDSQVQAVATATGNKIAAICPGGSTSGDCTAFDGHGFKESPGPQWVISGDTGVHPNADGHMVLAQGVFKSFCPRFGYFCDEARVGGGVYWNKYQGCSKKDIVDRTRCAWIAVWNNTPYTLSIVDDSLEHGEWQLLSGTQLQPGFTSRANAEKAYASSYGAEGRLQFQATDASGKKGFATIDFESPFSGGGSCHVFQTGDLILPVLKHEISHRATGVNETVVNVEIIAHPKTQRQQKELELKQCNDQYENDFVNKCDDDCNYLPSRCCVQVELDLGNCITRVEAKYTNYENEGFCPSLCDANTTTCQVGDTTICCATGWRCDTSPNYPMCIPCTTDQFACFVGAQIACCENGEEGCDTSTGKPVCYPL